MNAFFYALMSLALAATNVNAIGETLGCARYSSSPKGITCDGRADIICTEGCKSFVTSDECTLPEFPKKPATSELCTISFGSYSATTRTCVNGQGAFTCTGNYRGQANCSGCLAPNDIPWAPL